jgi:DNA-binding NtrC family response regulator
MSGIDLKKRLEEMQPDMKFIFVTGHGSEEDYNIVHREGFCCIVKPFKIETLVEKIKQALETGVCEG